MLTGSFERLIGSKSFVLGCLNEGLRMGVAGTATHHVASVFSAHHEVFLLARFKLDSVLLFGCFLKNFFRLLFNV